MTAKVHLPKVVFQGPVAIMDETVRVLAALVALGALANAGSDPTVTANRAWEHAEAFMGRKNRKPPTP